MVTLMHLALQNSKLRNWTSGVFLGNELQVGTKAAIEWMEDMRLVDGIGEWGWKVFAAVTV